MSNKNFQSGIQRKNANLPASSGGSVGKGAIVAATSHTETSVFYSPYPPPEALSQYNEVMPGSAERLIQLIELQTNHRMSLEKAVVNSDIRRASTGLWLGFLISLVALALAGYCSYRGLQVAACFIAGADIVSLAGVFVYGTKVRSRRGMQNNSDSPDQN